YAHGQAGEEARHAAFGDVAAQAYDVVALTCWLDQRDEVVLVTAGAVQQEQRAGAVAVLEGVNEFAHRQGNGRTLTGGSPASMAGRWCSRQGGSDSASPSVANSSSAVKPGPLV